MDIAAVSVLMNQARVSQDAGIAVLKKSMTSAEIMAQDLLKVLEQSVNPHLGQNVDIRI